MYSRKILVLANSRKHSGRCIAGIDLDSREWVRPINNPREKRSDPTAFSDYDLKKLYGDPFGPKLLDCVSLDFSKKIPEVHQPENELIKGTKWEFIDKLPIKSLYKFIVSAPCEWMRNCTGYTDRISRSKMESKPVSSSLILLHLNKADNKPEIRHSTTTHGYPQSRLSFTYKNIRFDLSLTDNTYPLLQESYSDEEMLKDFYVTIGLGELYAVTSSYHKLVVGFMPRTWR